MTLQAIFKWKHPDSTVDMNARLQTLVPRGIFDGGEVTPGAGLTVNVSAFKAISYDGMLVIDDTVTVNGVVANQTNYVVVRAKYVSGSTPTVQWEVLSQAAYNADPDKNYLVVFAVVTVPAGATGVTNSYISTLARDAVDPMQRLPYRGNTVLASLPAVPPEQNRDGDLYFVTDQETFYWWNAATTSWQAISTGSYNVETGSMADVIIGGERNRKEQGSGVIGGIRPADGFASKPDITIVETPSVADQIGFDTFSCIINGHYVQPYARYVSLPAKPGGGTRHDLIFLEAYRESITVPENHDFPRNPDGSLTYTITEVSDQVEQILYQAGVGGNNFDLNELQSDDHSWVVTKYRIGTVQGVAVNALFDNQNAASSALNVDGNAFSAAPGTGIDERVWRATSTTSSDGYSWAIPLFVIKRTASEDHTIGQAVQVYRDDVRWVFPVYAVADVSQAARLNIDTTAREQPFNFTTNTDPDYTRPSGFINGLDYPIQNIAGINNVQFYEDEIRFRIRGLEDNLRINSGPSFNVGGAPATGYERVVVYLKLCYTMYSNDPTQNFVMVSDRHRPLYSDKLSLSAIKGTGWKRGYVTYEMEVYDLGAAATELDENDAMTTAGWTKGDLSLASIGQQYSDGGVWSKAVTHTTDERVPIFGHEWAIPVCLIHRKNGAAWDWSTNPNGTGANRPDGHVVATTIPQDDILDLRRQVDVDEARLAEMLEADIDKLMRGQLRTRMAEKWAGTAGSGGVVAGTRLLQSDHTNASSNAFRMTAPDGYRKIWSDAKEFVPVATSFPLDADYGTGSTPVQFTNVSGTLVIRAPAGSHLVRALPSEFLVDGDSGNATYLDFNGEPLWTTQHIFGLGSPTFTRLKWIDPVTGTQEEQNVFDNTYGTALETTTDPVFTVTVSDTLGHATEMSITLADVAGYASADRMMVSFWVQYPRNTTGSEYVSNYGLAEIPDEVYAVYKDPTGTPIELGIGTLATTVRKTVTISTNVVITSADVLAASGTTGTTATIVGFDRGSIAYDTAPGTAFASATLDAPQTTLTITHGATFSADVDVVVYYYTDVVDSWIEVARGGKSVRAYYDWSETDIDLTGVSPTNYAVDLLTGVWSFAEVAGRMLEMPIIWESATGTGGPWTYVVPGASPLAGYQYSNMISFDVSASVSQRYIKVVAPRWQAPAAASADEYICHYVFSPYGGLSSTGGAKAVPATAVPKLKKMLHGTIKANSPHIVTQSGCCSIFGGLNSWSGAQLRYPQQELNFGGGRFRQYNQTQLVKSTKANGTIDFTGTDPQAMYAGAVMRLPYPANPAMLEGGLYPKSVMDWDLDPGREGAGAGYAVMAPGYQNDLSRLNLANGLHYDQFVNGLTRLSLGSSIRQDTSVLVPAAAAQMDDTSVGTIVYDSTTHSWLFQASESMIGDTPITSSRGMVPLLVTTALDGLFPSDIASGFGVSFYSPLGIVSTVPSSWFTGQMVEYNSPVTLDGTNPVLACVVPGTASLYNRLASLDTYPVVRIDVQASATVGDRYVGQSFVIQDGPQQHVPSPQGYAYDSSRVVDTVCLPFGSSSYRTTATGDESNTMAAASLRGRVVRYPASWGTATETALEALIVPSTIFHSTYGRGLYLGSTTTMYTMPMLIPGSGEPVYSVMQSEDVLVEKTAQPPEQYPTSSAVSPFNHSVRENIKFDHGGPIAYSFYGVIIDPDDSDYAGQAVMQISGGPMGPRNYLGSSAPTRIGDDLDGTAIDAFWPTSRPILRTK